MINEINNGLILTDKVKQNVYALLQLMSASENSDIDTDEISQVIESLLEATWEYHIATIKGLIESNNNPIKQ